MVHRIPDRADEQGKEAKVVPLLTPSRTIWIDWSTGEISTAEPIEPRLFHSPRRGLRGKTKQR